MNRLITWLVIAVFLMMTGIAHAQTSSFNYGSSSNSGSVFRVDPVVDGSIMLLSSMVVFVPILTESEIEYRDPESLDRNDVNSLDRGVIDNNSNGFRTASHIGVVAVPLGVYGLTFLYDKNNSSSEIIQDITMISESVMVNAAFNQIMCHSFSRPRPYMYTDERDEARNDNWDYRSFYSGHTSNAMAACTAIAYIHSVRYPDSPYKTALWTASALGCTAIGAARIAAGDHYYSDVLTGLVAGFSIGVLVPEMHRVGRMLNPNISLSLLPAGAGVTLSF
ncbi:MAG: phosphatase PAP2 family protein [Spirochaetes bacterium]|nr:phosphatase PAP2 family protein [Spirochaetota bacterium]MBN2772232.1 phosphatase PAP2 family protein [Spirochaetota bacterium]